LDDARFPGGGLGEVIEKGALRRLEVRARELTPRPGDRDEASSFPPRGHAATSRNAATRSALSTISRASANRPRAIASPASFAHDSR
jgi:hypothetical protein